MLIDQLPADETGYAQWYDVLRAARRADRPDVPGPSRAATYAGLRLGWPGETVEHWAAYRDGTVVGVAELTLPRRDNPDNSWIELEVHPDHRRQGVGSALLARCRQRALDDGRKRMVGEAVEPLSGGAESPGARFAARHGAKRALEEQRRRLVLDEAADLTGALAEAWRHAGGYSLVQWTEQGAADDAVADLAALDSDFLGETPLGDMQWEPEDTDVAQFRAVEQAMRDRAWELCHTGVRHDESGQVVAWTQLGVEAGVPGHVWQSITLVRPDHRGHRLGTVIKLENLRFARRRWPEATVIDSHNATVNQHMVAINDLMGYRPVDLLAAWQLEL